MDEKKPMTYEEYLRRKAEVLGMVREEPGLMFVDQVRIGSPELEEAVKVLLIERILRGEK